MLPALVAGLTLAIGQNYSALELSHTGVPWVTERRGPGRGAWGKAGAPMHAVKAKGDWYGALVARPDGGMWVVVDRKTVLRVDPDGAATTFHVPAPYAASAAAPLMTAGLPDGSLIMARALERFERVAPDGTASVIPTKIPEPEYCQADTMVSLADGTLEIGDGNCTRLIALAPSGAVTVRPLGENEQAFGLLAHSDGSIWVGLSRALGRLAPDGTLTRLAAPRNLGNLSEAPDASVWAAVFDSCSLVKVAGGAVTRVGAPFPVVEVRFAADGSAWLMGASKLAHVAQSALKAPARCDVKPPGLRLPDVHNGKIRIAQLRRGLRVHTSEPAVVAGTIAGQDFEQVAKRAGTVRIKFPRAVRKRLKPGARLEFLIYAYDLNGNPGGGSPTLKVTR